MRHRSSCRKRTKSTVDYVYDYDQTTRKMPNTDWPITIALAPTCRSMTPIIKFPIDECYATNHLPVGIDYARHCDDSVPIYSTPVCDKLHLNGQVSE